MSSFDKLRTGFEAVGREIYPTRRLFKHQPGRFLLAGSSKWHDAWV